MRCPKPRFLAWVGLAASGLGAAGAAPALEESSCRLRATGFESVLAACSTLEVPENPDAADGRTIELAVARIPALASVPLADPLVVISGGPGQSSIDLYLQLRDAFRGVLAKRDIVLMDQRGTGRSAAGYSCPTPADLDFQTAAAELLETLVERCLAALERDPRLFTTSIAVRDLERLREALGVEQWNLYGISYGTRVAQHYLRRYPDRTRSVVLDGSVPAEVVLGPDIAAAAQEALDAIFARCNEDDACRERFGDLESKFAAARANLGGGSVTITRTSPETGEPEDIALTDAHLLGLTRLMSYSTATTALLPLLIDEAAAGRYATLLAQVEMIFTNIEQALSFPMHNSVVCAEDAPRLDGASAELGAGAYLGSSIVDALFAICARWPVGPVDPDFYEPLTSERPVLLLSGSNDPVTPPRYAERIAAGLRNSLHVVAPDQGHGIAAIGCAPRLIADFLDAAGFAELDPGCIDVARPLPFFLSPAGPAP